MSQPVPDAHAPVHDLIGVGFGPSNLAMAIALREHNAGRDDNETITGHFLERQAAFGWHRGMLIDDATMQVSFLKDLVTLRNPTSEFSFLCYLRDRGRLVDFINHKNLFPLRIEFHDYFEWAAARVDDQVTYGAEVLGVRPVRDADGVIDRVEVCTRVDGGTVTHLARNLVVGTGLRPRLPEGVTPSARVWHNSDLLHRVEAVRPLSPRGFVVVGAGQSAAESVAFLHREFPGARVSAVFARYGYSPADDSPFANRIFDPSAVHDYYTSPEQVKQRLMAYHGGTNYGVVDLDLISDLYRRSYQEQVTGDRRLRFHNVCRVTDLVDGPDRVRLRIESLVDGSGETLDADVVVYATGYHEADPLGVLGELGAHCTRDDLGRLAVDRDYRVITDRDLRCGIYLQGGTEHSHGITSSLLSNTAIRVGEMLDSVAEHRRRANAGAALAML